MKPIKHGSFGSVFMGKNTITDEYVAIKVDRNTDTLKHETTILQYLSAKDCKCVPPIFNYGKLSNEKNYLVMPYYQTSLAEYLSQYPEGISPEHAKEILQEMFNALKHIHRRWVIHRDIKPANFMIKLDKRPTIGGMVFDKSRPPERAVFDKSRPPERAVFDKEEGGFPADKESMVSVSLVLIDFGLATYYMTDSKTHIPMEVNRKQEDNEFLIGSRRYASINIHLGNTPSRRDDLISAAYIYVAARWPKYMYDENENPNWIEKKRLENLPEDSRQLFKYLYELSFMESPDYEAI